MIIDNLVSIDLILVHIKLRYSAYFISYHMFLEKHAHVLFISYLFLFLRWFVPRSFLRLRVPIVRLPGFTI